MVQTEERTTMNNVLQLYKHRYRNIQIKNIDREETDITIKFSNSDYKFIVTIVDSDKLVVFRDNKDQLYHIAATDEILDVNTEIFVDSSDINDPKVLVVENDTLEYMIISKKGTKKGYVSCSKDLRGEISNYYSKDFKILKTGVEFTRGI